MTRLPIVVSIVLCSITVFTRNVDSARILVVYPLPGTSHYILGNAIGKGLAQAGHDVTMLSPFEEKNPPKNGSWRNILIKNVAELLKNDQNRRNMFEAGSTSPFKFIGYLNYIGHLFTNLTLSDSNVQNLLNSKTKKFDLVVVEQFNNDAMKAFAHHFNAPLVIVSSVGANSWVNSLVANPSPPSYVPEMLLSYSEHMTFSQRLFNTIFSIAMELNRQFIFFPNQEKLMKQYFPNPPNFYDVLYNASLILLNSHVSGNQAVPHVPQMIEVGGFHIFPPEKLSKDLQDFLDDAKEGVIYFSMGSNLRSTQMPKEKRDAILKAFSKLKQKVIWKWEEENLPNKPSNVKISKWLPQKDILAHPNIKLFITHGGLLSTTETIYHGVPVLSLPIFGDQRTNAAQNELNGFGLTLDFYTLTEEKMLEAINKLILNPKYLENAKRRSKIFHDRQVKPLESAVYWMEYVIRHKGAPHLKVAGVKLPWYKYLLLDVFTTIILTIFLIFLLFVILIKKIIKNICKCKGKNKVIKNNSKNKVKKN